ncbi:uncharacterized protein LOC129560012 [Moschus berezovskii]|uniref:uncharacterized protein LOC129560012 n=1 Tax=Moschus berezovskii TaxID=68408 RepID=UPI0024438935|nr:uncharacterized protein LOC129560012 [Moschus berezovskii]
MEGPGWRIVSLPAVRHPGEATLDPPDSSSSESPKKIRHGGQNQRTILSFTQSKRQKGRLREGWARGRGARGRALRRGHALPAAATRSKFPPSLPGAGSRSPPTQLRPSRRGRRQLGSPLPRAPDPAAFPVSRSALLWPRRPGTRPSRASTPSPRRPRSPVPGLSRTGERGRAVFSWTSRAPLLFFLTLELEANKTLQPGKEVKVVSCSGEYLKGARIPCDSCLQLGKHSFPSQNSHRSPGTCGHHYGQRVIRRKLRHTELGKCAQDHRALKCRTLE